MNMTAYRQSSTNVNREITSDLRTGQFKFYTVCYMLHYNQLADSKQPMGL